MKKLILVSGGFDPVHVGHIRMFKEAKALGDELIVILNCDRWLRRKKGANFMFSRDRAEIIKSIKYVDRVCILESNKKDITAALRKFKPYIYANGGDRNEKDSVDKSSSLYADMQVCKELGIKMVFNVGGKKVRSSSNLLKKYGKSK